ncbi:MAG: ATP-dependent DNA helicase [Propionibacteriaceae bacterium]|nr:ATP-dependent DNA helicase [Propionibacteriaceae bacterium]
MTCPSREFCLTQPPPPRVVSEWSADQRGALAHAGGPVLVVGGPGTGKTELLIEWVARKVASGTRLDRVLVLTHSRAAAQRLRMRIVRRVGGAHLAPRVTTVHGLCLSLIRQHADSETWGELQLLQAPEQELRLWELLRGHDTSAWPPELAAAAPVRSFAAQLRPVLARARQLGLDPGDIAALGAGDRLWGAVGEFFEEYLTVLDFEQTLDYAELVHRTRLILRDDGVRAAVRSRLDAIAVDEFAELDPAQLGVLTDLAGLGAELFAVADPQQSVFGFRGAQAESTGWFRAAFPHAQVRFLDTNHRGGPELTAAWAGIAARLNAAGAPPPSRAAAETSCAVRAFVYDSPAAELSHLAHQLRDAHLRDGVGWSQCAVIARTGRRELSAITRALRAGGIPVEVAGDEIALSEQLAVRPMLLALRTLLADGVSAEEALALLTCPLIGLDAVRLRGLGRRLRDRQRETAGVADPSGVLFAGLLNDPASAPAGDEEAAVVAGFGRVLASCRDDLHRGASPHDLAWRIWSATGWPDRLREAALGGDLRAGADLDALCELFERARRLDRLAAPRGLRVFLAEVSGQSIPADTARESDLRGRGVQVLTAHRAKGRQFRRVFVVGLCEGNWPAAAPGGGLLGPDSLDAALTGAVDEARIGYERRLFYVACSRATERLTLSGRSSTDEHGERASRFLGEAGAGVEQVVDPAPRPLTLPGLIADLRQVASDPDREPALRRAAANRLARLAGLRDSAGRLAAPGADPSRWWGIAEPSGEASPTQEVRLASTDISELIDCPRRWFLHRRVRAERPAAAASVGQVVHLLAQYAISDGIGGDQLGEQLERVWDAIPFEAGWLSESERRDAEAALARLIAWQSRPSGRRVLGVEVEFSTTVRTGSGTVGIHGSVDRLELDQEGRLRVVDFKTSRHLPSAKEVASHDQLGIYQLAAQEGAFDDLAPGVRRVGDAELVLLRGQDRRGDGPLVCSQPSLDDVPRHPDTPDSAPTWVHDRIERAAAIVASEDFVAKRCAACRMCAYQRGCPALHATPGVIE